MNDSHQQQPRRSQRWLAWAGLSMLLVALLAVGLHLGSGVREQENVRDEYLMQVPVQDILQDGWTVETMLDYQELKGPAFFWTYAAGAELLGGDGDINDLRLISVIFFIAGVLPILLIARRCGIAGPRLLLVALLYALLPYHAFLGQLYFSEPSFMFFAMVLMWIAVWGLDPSGDAGRPLWIRRRLIGPVLLAVVLSILLHHRPVAVAFAGAVCLAAFERDRWRSWPWWLACLLAGLSRIPLYLHWDGMVTSDYQGVFGFGVNPPALTYMLAALLPMTGILLWPVVRDRRGLVPVAFAAGAGLGLGLLASPTLGTMVEAYIPGWGQEHEQLAYAGLVGTAVQMVTSPGWGERIVMALLCMLGSASLAALGGVAFSKPALSSDGVVRRLAFWTLAVGLPLYVMTDAPVYDRYLMVWTILMPIVWLRALRPWPLALQVLGLLVISGYLILHYIVM